MLRVCFVCLGNICRSPTAEGIFLGLLQEAGLAESIEADSAGTTATHAGERADARSRATARTRGVTLHSRSRKFTVSDFERFDYVLAMDSSNEAHLRRLARTPGEATRVRRLREFHPDAQDLDVPDPYYGGSHGFEDVFDICDAACRGFLAHLRQEHNL